MGRDTRSAPTVSLIGLRRRHGPSPGRYPVSVTELLTHLDLLTQRNLDPTGLRVDGVAFGSAAGDVPRHRVANVDSPIVARSFSGTGVEPRFWDTAGRRLSLDEVVDSLLTGDGVFHFDSKVSFVVRAGVVAGFTIYGSQLRHFDHLGSYDDFLRAFYRPDRVEVGWDDLDNVPDAISTYWHYNGYCKVASWSVSDRRISDISLRRA
jgi:hypothetical protein